MAHDRPSPLLYGISDRARVGQLGPVAQEMFAAGLDWLQVREKDLATAELIALVADVVRRGTPHGARVLVNQRLDVALATGAAGVHLRDGSTLVDSIRRSEPQLVVGVSVHSVARALAAADDGADFVVFGPVYATPSKVRFGPPQGLDLLQEVADSIPIPVIAVGGIDPSRVRPCLEAGARGVAAIRGLFGVADGAAAVRSYRAELTASRP